jgi:LmbE family N-acetylglucosaminyl deacetylase
MRQHTILGFIILFLCVSASQRLTAHAQVRPIYDQGELGLTQLLKRLNTNASALMIGAHPDDEDTALLAYLARGENARTAYLSLTRGDGGQNIIGPELGEALGVIRTEELLQARRLDRAEQFFARSYDYGFSKTLAEAKQKWDERIVLCDVVRVIRSYRPLVVIAQFTGTPADGHGQHQYAGYIVPLAVKAAADTGQCAETGPAWRIAKLYVRHRGNTDPTLRVDTGRYDPLLGRSYFEIAMHARSQHRSQEQGVLELKGDQFSMLNLVSAGPTGSEIFGGLDTSVAASGDLLHNSEPRFSELAKSLDASIRSAVSAHAASDHAALLKRLVEGYKLAYDAEWSTRQPHSKALMREKQKQFLSAIKLAAGIQVLALSDRETVTPGEKLSISVKTFVADKVAVQVRDAKIVAPGEWVVARAEPPAQSQPTGFFRRETGDHEAYFTLTVANDATPTQPYWLRSPRTGDLFNWMAGSDPGNPFSEPVPVANVTAEISGVRLVFEAPVEFRYADDVRGEIRRFVNVVPKFSVSLDQDLMIVSSRTARRQQAVSVSVTNNIDGAANGKVRLVVPAGWRVVPAETDLAMERKGESRSINFRVSIPQSTRPSSYSIAAEMTSGGETFSRSTQTLAYEHIQTHRLYRPAAAAVKLIDLQTVPVKVGYIRGSGDRVADAIKRLGVQVEDIDERTLAAGDLAKFDTIIVGIRAYQVRQDIVANNQRLLEFAQNGGTLVVQYQLPPSYSHRNLTPFPTQMGPRVADENAPVALVEPAHPLLNFPNKITQEDFAGWVQERNLYNFVQMDPKYIGLLESHDAGEAENRGGLVVADLGKGKFVYCSYSLFRQLPAGVPGAYRLLANLISYRASRRNK